jgi:hypothetical protein
MQNGPTPSPKSGACAGMAMGPRWEAATPPPSDSPPRSPVERPRGRGRSDLQPTASPGAQLQAQGPLLPDMGDRHGSLPWPTLLMSVTAHSSGATRILCHAPCLTPAPIGPLLPVIDSARYRRCRLRDDESRLVSSATTHLHCPGSAPRLLSPRATVARWSTERPAGAA